MVRVRLIRSEITLYYKQNLQSIPIMELTSSADKMLTVSGHTVLRVTVYGQG